MLPGKRGHFLKGLYKCDCEVTTCCVFDWKWPRLALKRPQSTGRRNPLRERHTFSANALAAFSGRNLGQSTKKAVQNTASFVTQIVSD
jgi:hypothetical protein